MVFYQWDEQKSLANRQKHGFDFSEAAKAFEDPNLVIINSKQKIPDEARFIAIGNILKESVFPLVVVFTLRNGAIRIISAHKPNKIYLKLYLKNLYGSSN